MQRTWKKDLEWIWHVEEWEIWSVKGGREENRQGSSCFQWEFYVVCLVGRVMYTDISMDLSRVFFPLKTETDSSKRNVIPFISLSFIGIFCRILLRQWFLDQHAELQTNCLQSTCHFIEGSGAILTSGLAYKKYVIPTPLYRAAYSIRVLKVQYARILGDTLVQSASCFLRSWKTWLENSVM